MLCESFPNESTFTVSIGPNGKAPLGLQSKPKQPQKTVPDFPGIAFLGSLLLVPFIPLFFQRGIGFVFLPERPGKSKRKNQKDNSFGSLTVVKDFTSGNDFSREPVIFGFQRPLSKTLPQSRVISKNFLSSKKKGLQKKVLSMTRKNIIDYAVRNPWRLPDRLLSPCSCQVPSRVSGSG